MPTADAPPLGDQGFFSRIWFVFLGAIFRLLGILYQTGPVSALEFGAKGDGVTDDARAIQKALDAAAADGGGAVRLPNPPVAFLISTPLIVPPEVQLVGAGRNCYIRTSASFPADSYAVRLGDGTGYAFSTRLENCILDVSRSTRCGGVYSNNVQEQSGLKHVIVTGYNSWGAYFTGTGGNVANFLVDDCEFLAATEAGFNATAGLWVENSSWKVTVKNISVVPHSRVVNTAAGIKASNATLEVFAGHVEGHKDGILFDTDSHGGVFGLTGEANTNLIRINTGGRVAIHQVRRAAGTTNTIKDDRLSRTITDAAPNLYVTDGTEAFYAANALVQSDSPIQIGNGYRGGSDSLTIDGSVARICSDAPIYIVLCDADGTQRHVVESDKLSDGGTLKIRNRVAGPLELYTSDVRRVLIAADGKFSLDTFPGDVAGSVVTTDAGQTLKNKDLTDPSNTFPSFSAAITQHVVTGSRAIGSTYQNTTGKPMTVTVTATGTGASTVITGITAYSDTSATPAQKVAAQIFSVTGASYTGELSVTFQVPNNSYYKILGNNSPTLTAWIEWY